MSTLTVLKEYLIGNGGYLLNDDNNGKTVMLSGAWGSGKTHFWLEDIKPELIGKKQKNIYISLYGRESISELKFEVLREAYNLEVKEDFISKTASMMSSIAPSLGEKSLVDGFDKLNKKTKEKKAEEILKSGSIICLDDFERKSTKIDLNNLFGYISQLALDYNCKVVVILNSDVFEGEEANIFKTVKEKTVNKFFYFEPTRRELFDSIYDRKDNKYEKLDAYREDIFNAIDETEELNARIYIQVLDNCLEWINRGYQSEFLRILVLTNINFALNHCILSYAYHEKVIIAVANRRQGFSIMTYNNMSIYSDVVRLFVNEYRDKKLEHSSIGRLFSHFYKNQSFSLGEEEYKRTLSEVIKNEYEIKSIIKYGYSLCYVNKIKEEEYRDIVDFIKTGILLNKYEES